MRIMQPVNFYSNLTRETTSKTSWIGPCYKFWTKLFTLLWCLYWWLWTGLFLLWVLSFSYCTTCCCFAWFTYDMYLERKYFVIISMADSESRFITHTFVSKSSNFKWQNLNFADLSSDDSINLYIWKFEKS